MTSPNIRDLIRSAGFEIDASVNHQQMGEGFFIIEDEAGEEFAGCTWSIAQQSGFVFICELFDASDIPPGKIVATQLAAGIRLMTCLKELSADQMVIKKHLPHSP